MPINADSFLSLLFWVLLCFKVIESGMKKDSVYGCNLALRVSTDLTLILFPLLS